MTIEIGKTYKCTDGTMSTIVGRQDGRVQFREGDGNHVFSWSEQGFRDHHVIPDAPAPEVPSGLPAMIPPGATIVRVDFFTADAGPEHVISWTAAVLS